MAVVGDRLPIEENDAVAQQVREIAARLEERTYPGGPIGATRLRGGRAARPAFALPVAAVVDNNDPLETMALSLEQIAAKVEGVEKKIDGVEKKIDTLSARVDALETRSLKAIAIGSLVTNAIVCSGICLLAHIKRP